MSEDSQTNVSVPTVFVNGKEIPLNGEFKLTEEDMQKVIDAVNDSIAESLLGTLQDLQKGLPLIAQFLQNRKFFPKIEGNLTGNVKLKFNDRTLFKLELPKLNESKNEENDEPEETSH